MFQFRSVKTAAIGVAVVLTTALAGAQTKDTIPASGGNIIVIPINHATVEFQYAGKTILVDPTPQGSYTGLPSPDLILLTDIHADHMDPATVDKVKTPGTTIVVPQSVVDKIPGTVMKNGEKKTVAGVEIEAVPMYNMQRGPAAGQVFHEKGRGNGYILTLGGKRVYLSGDTECTPEVKALQNIDVAFLSMNLPYTMPASEAAECVKAFKPKIVYPYHYRGQNLQEFADALKGTAGVEVRIRDWYAPAAAK
jgi:L-ascorbate metabolism protein UlaG (beta-lactamase superfamily)